MKKQPRVLLSIIASCASLIFTASSMAEELPNHTNLHLKRFSHCPTCQPLAENYNDNLEKLLNIGDDLDDMDDDISEENHAIDAANVKIRHLQSHGKTNTKTMRQTEALRNHWIKRHDEDVTDFNEKLPEYRALQSKVDGLRYTLNECEATYCKK
jgi:peptidoglycan hydrolase CwlO-like protein